MTTTRIAALLLATLLAPLGAHAQTVAPAPRSGPEIVATGTGLVKLKPDRATITVAVVTKAASAAAAGKQNADRIRLVLAALKRQGIADTAIVTAGYVVTLEGDQYGRPPAAADAPPVYVARNAIEVTYTDLENLGQLLDTALTAGATEIAGVAFGSSQARAGRERAIAEAVKAARADAAIAATAAGGTLGALVELILEPGYIGVAGGMAYRTASATPVMPADVSIQVQARLRYSFSPGR